MKRMKWLAIVAVAFISMAIHAGNELVKYVPEDASLIVNIDTKKLLALPAIKKIVDDPANTDMTDVKKTIGKYGLKLNDVADSALIFLKANQSKMEPDGGFLVQTKVSQKDAGKLIQDMMSKDKDNKVTMSTQKIAGKEVFIFKGEEGDSISTGPLNMNDEGAMTYLAPNVALVTSKANLESYLKSLKKTLAKTPKLMAVKSPVKKQGLVWGCLNVKELKPPTPPNPQGQPNPLDQIKTGAFSVDMGGKTQEDLMIRAALECVDAQSSQTLAMQAQMGMMFIAGMFQQDPQLGLEVTKSIKITPSGNNLLVNVDMKKAILDKLKEAAQKQNQMMPPPGGGMPMPPPAPPTPAKEAK